MCLVERLCVLSLKNDIFCPSEVLSGSVRIKLKTRWLLLQSESEHLIGWQSEEQRHRFSIEIHTVAEHGIASVVI